MRFTCRVRRNCYIWLIWSWRSSGGETPQWPHTRSCSDPPAGSPAQHLYSTHTPETTLTRNLNNMSVLMGTGMRKHHRTACFDFSRAWIEWCVLWTNVNETCVQIKQDVDDTQRQEALWLVFISSLQIKRHNTLTCAMTKQNTSTAKKRLIWRNWRLNRIKSQEQTVYTLVL